MKKLFIVLFVISFPFVLTGCGGGGGGDSSTPTPPVVNESAEGTWTGTVTTAGKSVGFVGLVSKTGETFFMVADPNYTSLEIITKADEEEKQISREINMAKAFSPDKEFILREQQALERLSSLNSVIIYTQNLSTSGNQFSSYLYSYNYLCQMNGGYNASGTVITRSTISGNISDPSLGSGSFSFSYDPTYDRGSDLAKLAGDWTVASAYGSISTQIRSDGTFSGVITPSNVTFSGTFSILDQAHNCYLINFNVNGVGVFNGLAVLADSVPQSGANDVYLAVGRSADGSKVFPLSGQKL